MQSPKRIEPVENEQADYQVREVDLNWQRLAPLNSRIETLQTRNLPLRTVIISLLVLDGLDSFWRLHGLPPAMVLKSTRKGHCLEAKAPSLGMPKTFAQPLPIRRNIENSYH